MDLEKYKTLFVDEASDHLQQMGRAVVELESGVSAAASAEAIDLLFRMAHSIKGMAASLEYGSVSTLAHRLEDYMDPLRGGAHPSSHVLSVTAQAIGVLERMVADVAERDEQWEAPPELLARLAARDYGEPADLAALAPSARGRRAKKVPASSRPRYRGPCGFAPRRSTASWRLWVS